MLDFNMREVVFGFVLVVALVSPALANSKSRSGIKEATTFKSTKRENARLVYNDTLKTLFDDIKAARTTTEQSEARRRARRGFQDAIKQVANYPQPYFNLPVLAEAEENWDEASRLLEQFRQLDATSELS